MQVNEILTTVLETDNLSKIYRLGEFPVRALNGVSFKVSSGEYVGILGPSGSGKSTLLNLIGALDRPTRGRLRIEGQDISVLNDNQLAKIRRRVGFVFQFFNLITRMDAIGNVELPLAIRGVEKQERRKKATKLLEDVGLGERMTHRPSELSGGERQRVAIARALVSNPSYVLLDEPTGNLDTKSANDIVDMVNQLNREDSVTIVMVTHDQNVASNAARIVKLVDGKIDSDEVS
ncbi:MAG: ABC transporter ATP-binding protein [Candidatus Thorarchaeota archaeon]